MSITQEVLQLLEGSSRVLSTFIISFLPIVELRGAIPIGLIIFELPWTEVYLISCFGNILVVPILFYLLKPIESLLSRFEFFKRLFQKLTGSAKSRVEKKLERYELFGLVIFVSIPLPVTGAWTATIAAYVLRLNFPKTLLCISVGVLTAGAIVTALTLGGVILYNL